MSTPEILGVKKRPQGTFDAGLLFKDSGLVAANAAANVGGSAKVVNVGTGLFKGCMVLDVSALEVATGDELYTICVQGSTDGAFTDNATSATLAQFEIGAATPLTIGAVDSPGRFKIHFDNERNGTYFGYLRLYTKVAGTVASGINYTAYCVPDNE